MDSYRTLTGYESDAELTNSTNTDDKGWGDEMLEDLKLLLIENASSIDYKLLDGLEQIISKYHE